MLFLRILFGTLLVGNVFGFKVFDLSTAESDDNQIDSTSSSCEPKNSDCSSLSNFIDVSTKWNSDELYEVCKFELENSLIRLHFLRQMS